MVAPLRIRGSAGPPRSFEDHNYLAIKMLRNFERLLAASFRGPLRRPIVVVWMAIWLSCGVATANEAGEGTRHFGLSAGQDVVWIYDYRLDPNSDRALLHMGVRSPRDREFWVPAALRGQIGRVHSATSAGRDLFIIFDEKGAHRRYRLEDVARGTARHVRKQTEQPLPDGALPLTLASHPLDQSLYAIVTRETAHAIAADEIRRAQEIANETMNENSGSVSDAVEVDPIDVIARLGSAQFFAVRYLRSRWGVICEMPEWFDRQEECHLVVEGDGRIQVLFTEDTPAAYQHGWYAEGVWSALGRVSDAPGYRINSVCAGAGQVVAVGSIESGAKRSVFASTFEGERWVDEEPLVFEEGTAPLTATSFVSICTGDGIGLAVLSDREELAYGQWEIKGGAATASLREVAGLGPGRKASFSWQTQSMAAFVCLGALLMFTFLRRGDSITREADLPSQYVVAAYWRRFMSFVIDVAPIVIGMNRLWLAPFGEWLADYHEAQSDGGNVPPLSDDLLISWALCCVAFAAYCTFCEALFARTPGKAALCCCVVDEVGGRCGFSSILIRNAVRMVELFPLFQLWPTFILMLFTRNRQRLGDLLARTIVVEHARLSQTQDPSLQK